MNIGPESKDTELSPKNITLEILRCVASLPMHYGKNTIAGILVGNYKAIQNKRLLVDHKYFGYLKVYTEENVVVLLKQLIDIGYLKIVNVGFEFPIEVLEITDNGKAFIASPHTLQLVLPQVYSADFKEATELAQAGVTEELISEYYRVKRQVEELTKKEDDLKNHIKYCMMQHKVSRVSTNNVELHLREVERVLYPKAEVEHYVPKELLEKIRKVQKCLVLTIKALRNE